MTAEHAQQIDFAVELAREPHAVLSGHYYRPQTTGRRSLQVLLHGNSYDHRYWDVGRINGVDYSYARYMSERGYDVLAVDLPGTGASSKPHGDAVTLESVGAALASVVEAARSKDGPLHAAVDRVALVGHSLGAVVAVHAQARWKSAHAVVVTGTGYSPHAGPSPFGPNGRRDAMKTEYAWLPADLRRKAFYHLPTAEEDVIAFDNRALRTSMPRRLWADCLQARNDAHLSGITDIVCPVYIQLGEHDPIMPSCRAADERSCWPPGCEVVIETLDSIGHCFNLHRNHAQGWSAIDRFLSGMADRSRSSLVVERKVSRGMVHR